MRDNLINNILFRFDSMAKYLYIKYKDKNINTDFYKQLYENHIITFNKCWEYPGTKTKIDDFFMSFDNLIENIKKNGFNKQFCIPLGKNYIIINGMHRLMICFYYKINPVFTIDNNKNGDLTYNYDFFINRNNYWRRNNEIYQNLNHIYSDTMALNLVKIDKNMRVMITYPNINDKYDEIEEIINKYGYLYYKKRVKLTQDGIKNLIKELYRGEKWIGGLFPNGTGGKYECCKGDNQICLYLIHMYDLNKIIELKNTCRSIYGLGKHSLHMSDYPTDTFRISSALLNKNSIHFLNYGTNNISDTSKRYLTNYFSKLNNNDSEDHCITSNIILELYNVQNTYNIKDIDKDEIVYNPKNHFYFNGYKFATLFVISL